LEEEEKSSLINRNKKEHMTTKPPQQKILKGVLHLEDKNKYSHENMVIIKPQENRQVIRQ
jgi:hypothetical protein